MNLRQLEIFREVVASGSLTRAAHKLGISQPAVSAAVTNLESDVGFLLFKRTHAGTELTPEARTLAEEAARVLSAARNLETLALDLSAGRAGKLYIGCLPGFSPVFMPRVVAEFLEDHSGARISFQTHASEKVEQWVASGHWEIGLVELPDANPALEVRPLSLPMVCALHAGHPLATRAVVEVSDLEGEPLVTLDESHQTSIKLRVLFRKAGVRMAVRAECHLFPPACALVSEGVGVALVDPVTAINYEGPDLVLKPFRPRVEFDLAVIFPRHQSISRQCRAFAEHLERALDTLCADFERRGY